MRLNEINYVCQTTFGVSLDSYQAVEIQSIFDLTGVRVYTTNGQPFAFFSGNTRTKLPTSRGSRDHLAEQLPPTNAWASSYFSMPTPRKYLAECLWLTKLNNKAAELSLLV